VPEHPPESEAPAAKPKDKKPSKDKKSQHERKPLREKKPAGAKPTPAKESADADAGASGDTWGTEDVHDPWAMPTENSEQQAPAAKPSREKKSSAERKPPRERKPPAERKLAPGNNTSVGDAPTSPTVDTPTSPIEGDASNDKRKSQAYHNPERVLTGGAQRVSWFYSTVTEDVSLISIPG
jgi:hypothetical protein